MLDHWSPFLVAVGAFALLRAGTLALLHSYSEQRPVCWTNKRLIFVTIAAHLLSLRQSVLMRMHGRSNSRGQSEDEVAEGLGWDRNKAHLTSNSDSIAGKGKLLRVIVSVVASRGGGLALHLQVGH